MFSCMWNGERIDAFEISKPEGLEREIRKAARNKELRCIDPNCECPELGFKHGSKKAAHFYHYCDSNCGYTHFEKNDKPIIRNVRNALFDHFKSKGFNVERECRLPIGGKFCHLLFDMNNEKIVLQIADKTTQVKDIEKLQTACNYNKCDLKLIVVGDPNDDQDEYRNYQINRYLLNNSVNKDLVIINENSDTLSQTKYIEDNRFSGCEKYFKMKAPLDLLSFINGELSISEFYEKFNQWFSVKAEEKDRKKRKDMEFWRKVHEGNEKQVASFGTSVHKPARPFQPKYTSLANSNYTETDYSPKVEEPSYSPIDHSKFVVGVKVEHEQYGDGIIIAIDRKNGKACLKFDNGVEDNFSIDNLAKSSGFKLKC